MAVQTYSLRTQGNLHVSEHFTVREFACKNGADTVLIDSDLVTRLEAIRSVFGSGITITSAYRTLAYNRKIGSSDGSQHVKGKAADIQLRGVPPLAVANYVEETYSDGGIGVYSTFTHVDTRSRRTIWRTNGSNTSSTTGAAEGYWRQFQNGADIGGGTTGGEEVGNESGALDVIVKRFTVNFELPNGDKWTGEYFPAFSEGYWYFNDKNFYRCTEDFTKFEQYYPDTHHWGRVTYLKDATQMDIYLASASDG